MQQDEPTSQVAAFAAVLEGRGAGSWRGMTVQIGARLPVDQVAALDAMAAQSGQSRTFVLSSLLEVALEALRGEVDKKTAAAIRKAQGKRIAELLGEATEGEDA